MERLSVNSNFNNNSDSSIDRTVSPDSAALSSDDRDVIEMKPEVQVASEVEKSTKSEKKYSRKEERVDSGICISDSDIIIVRRARKRKPVSIKIKV